MTDTSRKIDSELAFRLFVGLAIVVFNVVVVVLILTGAITY